jgi:hypothetical protein
VTTDLVQLRSRVIAAAAEGHYYWGYMGFEDGDAETLVNLIDQRITEIGNEEATT